MNEICNRISTFYLPVDSCVLLFNNTEVKIQDLKENMNLFSFDTEDKKLSPAKVLNVEYIGKDVFYPVTEDTWIREDQQSYFTSQKYKIRSFNSLKRLDAQYVIKYYNQNIISIQDQSSYILGYLRGFWDGDGYLRLFNKGVTTYASFCQNKRDVLEEISYLLKVHLNIDTSSVREINCFKLQNKEMYELYINRVENSRKFLKETDFELNKSNYNYLLGYLNGNIIAEGNTTYNKATKMLACTTCQSIIKNPEIVSNITYCLENTDIYFQVYDSHKINDFYTIRNWKFSRPYRLPFIYGASKKNTMVNKFYNTFPLYKVPYKNIFTFNISSKKELSCYKLTIEGKGNTIFNNRLLLIGE